MKPKQDALAQASPEDKPIKLKAGHVTALDVARPRVLAKVQEAALFESAQIGSKAYYSWKQGGQVIEGPTIRLAETLYRNFGNCTIEISVEDQGDYFRVVAVFVDLETGASFPNIYEQRKSVTRPGRQDAERQRDIALQIAQSKAMRNAIVRGLPQWLIDQAIEAAKQGLREEFTADSGAARDKVLSAFSSLAVERDRIVARFGEPEDWTPEIYAKLRGIYSAIKEGVTHTRAEFPDPGEAGLGDFAESQAPEKE